MDEAGTSAGQLDYLEPIPAVPGAVALGVADESQSAELSFCAARRVALEFGGRICGIRREDSTITCFGAGASEPFAAPEGQFAEIAATNNGMCAVRTDGRIACFGDTELPVPAGW